MLAKAAFDFFKNALKDMPNNYLEIGVYNGDSISELSVLFPDKMIYGVDPFIEDGNTTHNSNVSMGGTLVNQRTSTYNLIEGKQNVKLFEVTSNEFRDSLTKTKITKMNVDSVFIDGDHHYEFVVNDFNLALELIGNKRGVIVFDDLHIDEVVRAVNEFERVAQDRIERRVDMNMPSRAYYLKET